MSSGNVVAVSTGRAVSADWDITTADLDVTGALTGERWRLGSAAVQVTSCRIPCVVFRSIKWDGEAAADSTAGPAAEPAGGAVG